MPMVVKPLDWTDPFNGGYLSQDVQGRQALVKTSNSNYLTELADTAATMPVVYESINALQSSRWRINATLHRTLREVWELGHPVAKLPSRDDIRMCPCPSCGASIPLPSLNTRGSTEHGCFSDEEVLRLWKQKAYECHSENVSLRSKRLALAKTLRIAETYADFEAIYFPYQLDFRGRIYAIPTFNPQGNDVTKALLHFADAKPIEDGVAAGWLAIHGANVYGYDKASLEDRIQWVEDHEQEIIASAEDPLSNTFWHGADKPWQFLAFCFEWAGFCREGYGFMSRLPIALDGSCSGIQHFSAMLRDRIGGRAVNLLPSDKPHDIYQMVCDKVVDKLKAEVAELGSTIAQAMATTEPSPSQGNENLKLKPEAIAEIAEATGEYSRGLLAAGWLSLMPNRKTTKRQVMTLPYGSTRFSCREYTEEWMMDRIKELGVSPFSKAILFKASQFMSDLIWDSISEVVVAARKAMDWLQDCAKVVADEELPVYWTTPVGFRVMQQYRNTNSRRVKTKLGDAIVKLSLQEEETTIDKRRMANAISPNVVHSLDASHLMMTVAYAKDNGIDHFSLIHDSFGCHAADTHLFSACIRKAFVDLYEENDVIEDLRQQFIRQVTTGDEGKIPACPSKGDLDLHEVLQSDFAFA
jgi:DNA-directed RNA polymerase